MEPVDQEPHYRGRGSYLTDFLFTCPLQNSGMELTGALSNSEDPVGVLDGI
jgi:hypothetical protein